MNINIKDRQRFRDFLCELDEKQVLEVKQQLEEELRNVQLLINDTQLRLDYLGVFTLQNITKLARRTTEGEKENKV